MRISHSTLLGLLLLSSIAAQDFEVPVNLPTTKDEFVKTEYYKVFTKVIHADKEGKLED